MEEETTTDIQTSPISPSGSSLASLPSEINPLQSLDEAHAPSANNENFGSSDVIMEEADATPIIKTQVDDSSAVAILQNTPEASTPFSAPRVTKQESFSKSKSVWTDVEMGSDESGTPEERAAFMKELESFHRDHSLDFKPPKFYGEPLNCLKLWRAVIKLNGYEVVTSAKLWRQVGESFHPPRTCTTVSWTFRNFYEKSLLEYEKFKIQSGELQFHSSPPYQPTGVEKEPNSCQPSVSGRARRDAAARAMQVWHSQRGHNEATETSAKDKNSLTTAKREKQLKSIGSHKPKAVIDHATKSIEIEANKELNVEITDIGPPAEWVKINVKENKDCFEVYALVPGLLREEVRVQSDPAGRIVITGQPEQVNNPWGITPFKKVISLPSKIDPLHTSAVVSLHGRLHIRVPFEH